mgnify:CR=1 FL=1
MNDHDKWDNNHNLKFKEMKVLLETIKDGIERSIKESKDSLRKKMDELNNIKGI